MTILPRLVSLSALLAAAPAQDRLTGLPHATRATVWAKNGMAASSQPLVSQVAIDVLKRGGNAIDAAIAANAMQGLCEPSGNGIGGDLFAIVWDAKTGKLYGLNGSGRAPKGLSLAWFKQQGITQIPMRSALAITVPGCVDAWATLHGRFGKLAWSEVLAPAIRNAKAGVPLSPTVAFFFRRALPAYRSFAGFGRVFGRWEQPPRPGDVFKNPALARTLSIIAKEGRDGFYTGEVAEQLCRYVQAAGGHLALEDLAAHRSDWVEPVSTNYRGYDVWELPPNGQGIAALQILNILEGYDLEKLGPDSADWAHLFVEAKKLAYEDRARFYADPAYMKVSVAQLLSKKYAAARRKLIDMRRAATEVQAGDPRLEKGDTIYLTVADRQGNMVSLIQSNYGGFGCGVTPPELGFGLQNRGAAFDLRPGRPNSFAPGKRPFHTIIPAFVTKDGKPWLSFGVMGGAMQPQGHVQILVNMIDFGMDPQEAGDWRRIRHYDSSQPDGSRMRGGGELALESQWSAAVRAELEARGHRFKKSGFVYYGGYQAVLWDAARRVYGGATEARYDGLAIGY